MTASIHAIVPAAGASRRMGEPKQFVDLGGRPMIARTVEPLLASEVAGVMIVTQPKLFAKTIAAFGRGESQPRAAVPQKAIPALCINADPGAHMIDSVRLGIAEWSRRRPVGPQDGFLIVPGDQPGVAAEDIDRCVAAFSAEPTAIIVAARGDFDGHPLIFPASLAGFVRSPACDGGLRALKTHYTNRVRRVQCGEATTRNVNTPDDVRRLTSG